MKFRNASVLATLVCAAQLTLFAPTAPAAEAAEPARVSVAYAGMPLKDALRQFQETSGLRLAYAEDLLVGAAPVTLRLDDAPAERVLRELLRPQGLEAILTDQNLAAVVPAWSDLGMAKAFGRALDIGLRLGNKLDGATVEGDEVRVPGWTAEDDADLALGITDLIVSIAYASSRPRINSSPVGRNERVEEIRALLRSADPMVRAGALMYGQTDNGSSEFGREIEQGLSDPHPVARTSSAILFAAAIENGQWPGEKSSVADAAAMLRKLAADPEAGVRMAAAFTLLISSHHVLNPAMDPDAALLDQLLADRSAFVRQTLRLGALALNKPRVGAPEGPAKAKWLALSSDDGLKTTLRDPNPIARALSFAFAHIVQLDQGRRDKAATRDRVAEIWTEAELAKDPWMKTIHGLLAPALAGDLQVALDKTVAAAGSDKPSHLAAAGLTFGVGQIFLLRGMTATAVRGGVEKPAPPKIPDLTPLAARLPSSQWLWARLSGIAVDAALPFVGPLSATPPSPEALKAAEDRQQAALRDPSEPMRLVALLALYGRTMAGMPCPPEPVVAALRGRRLPEMLLGAQLAHQGLAPERLLEEINVLLDDPSRRIATEALLGSIWRNRSLLRAPNTARLDFARQLAELVLARNDPALDIALFKNNWIWIQDTALREEMEERVLKSASLEAVAARYRNSGIETAQAVLLFDRLKTAAADPTQRTAVLEAWAVLSGRLFNAPDRKNLDVVHSLLDQAMAGEPADARAAAARARALPTLFSDQFNAVIWDQWAAAIERLPANLAKALEQALARAGDPTPSVWTVDLLVRTLSAADNAGGVKRGWLRDAWSVNHPALIQALDGAVQKVLEGPREDIKLQVWSELARTGDPMAVEALTERILDGRVPNQTLVLALIAASENPGLLPPGFLSALLETIRDPAENLSRRVQLVSVLNSCPGLWGSTLSEGLELLVWDDQAAIPLRSASLRMLISVLPNSDGKFEAKRRAIIRKAVASYDTLPVAMIQDNLDGLTESGRFGEETLEEELLVLVLGDKRLRGENDWWTYEKLFQSLAQSRGLATLQDPDRLRQALDKLEQEFPLVVQPPQGFQARGLEQLRGKLETVTPHR